MRTRRRLDNMGRRPAGVSGGVAWGPASLGASLLAWWTFDPLYCFTDAAKTANCVNGDPVRVLADRSGNGKDFTQATLGNRPILTLSAGKWFGVGNGTTQVMTTATTLGASGPVTCFAVCKIAGSSSSCALALDGSFNGNLRGDTFLLDGGNQVGSWFGGVTALTALSGQRSSGASKAWKDGVQSGATSAVALGATFANPAWLFDRGLGDTIWGGSIAEAFVVAGVMTDANKLLADQYVRNQWGTP